VACARCHDHKFDPIPTTDYYALAGIFTSTETMWGLAANEGLTAPKTDLHVLKASKFVPPPEGFEETVLVLESNTGVPKPVPKSPWPEGSALAMGVRDGKKPANCKVNIKGSSKKPGDEVPRGFLTACRFESANTVAVNPEQSGRLQLAEWLTQPDHPQTARVFVNRVWQHLFGTGIVATPDDFGVYGDRPTHPELLDYLAIQFADQGWSVKQLIRRIVLSRTYQMSGRPAASDTAVNRLTDQAEVNAVGLITHHSQRRLDAESLRDAMLAVSGQLNRDPAEASLIHHRDILVNLAGSLHEPSRHRSVYLCYLRSSPPPELAAFDLPEFTSVTGKRHISTIPAQALHLFNNPFVTEQSAHFAERVIASATDADKRIQTAWNLAFQRDPSDAEVQSARQLLDSLNRVVPPAANHDEFVWTTLCQGLLISNEFRYID
ncbi:MAG: DUF1553 domain-containing protein, partial [Planctomycetaceae bacterium]|nr:DUF1553 domain-containing protein [Planctomycetaceae bacterium]